MTTGPQLTKTHTVDEHRKSLAAYLPNGPLFDAKNMPGKNLYKLLFGMGSLLQRAEEMLNLVSSEYDIRYTTNFIEEWEKFVGIPDDCFPGTGTLTERRAYVLMKLTALGVQTVDDFVDLAALLGLTATVEPKLDTKITFPITFPITFDSPTIYPDDRFTIVVTLSDPSATTFPLPFPIPFGTVASGIIQCLFEDLKPANCKIEFNLTL